MPHYVLDAHGSSSGHVASFAACQRRNAGNINPPAIMAFKDEPVAAAARSVRRRQDPQRRDFPPVHCGTRRAVRRHRYVSDQGRLC